MFDGFNLHCNLMFIRCLTMQCILMLVPNMHCTLACVCDSLNPLFEPYPNLG